MNTLAKISIGASLAFLAACSGKGNAEARINSVDTDETDIPGTETDDSSESSSVKAACLHTSGIICVEFDNVSTSMLEDCNADNDGSIVSSCPSGGEKCGSPSIEIEGTKISYTLYAYEISCEEALTIE